MNVAEASARAASTPLAATRPAAVAAIVMTAAVRLEEFMGQAPPVVIPASRTVPATLAA